MMLNDVGSRLLLWLGLYRAYVDLRFSKAEGGCDVYKEDMGPPAGRRIPCDASQTRSGRRQKRFTTYLVEDSLARRPWVSQTYL